MLMRKYVLYANDIDLVPCFVFFAAFSILLQCVDVDVELLRWI